MADLPLISKITLPSGTVYEIKDAWSRERISALGQVMNFLGVTTTDIATNPSTNPISVGGETVTAGVGDVVIYGSKEFVWTGSTWAEFGDLSNINVGKNTSDLVSGTVPRTEYEVGTGTANVTITATATSAMGTGATFTTTVRTNDKVLSKSNIYTVNSTGTNVVNSVSASKVTIDGTATGSTQNEEFIQKLTSQNLVTSTFTPKVAGSTIAIGTTSITPAKSGTIALPTNASHVEVGTNISGGTAFLTGFGTPTTVNIGTASVQGIYGTIGANANFTLNGTATDGVSIVTSGTATNKLVTTTVTGAVDANVSIPNVTGVNTAKLAVATLTPATAGTAVSVAGTTYATAGSFPTLSTATGTSANVSKVTTAASTATLAGTYTAADENLELYFVPNNLIAGTVTEGTVTTYSLTGGAFPTLSSQSVTPAVAGSQITYATGGSTTTGDGAEFATGLTTGTAFTGLAKPATSATTVATGSVASNGAGAAVVTGLTSQYLHGTVSVPKAAENPTTVATLANATDFVTGYASPTTSKISVANASTSSTNIALPDTAVTVATASAASNVLTGLTDGTAFTYATGSVASNGSGSAVVTGIDTTKYIHVDAATTGTTSVATLASGSTSVVTGLEIGTEGDKVVVGIAQTNTSVSNTAAVNAVSDITKITIPAQTFTEQSTGHTHPVSAS